MSECLQGTVESTVTLKYSVMLKFIQEWRHCVVRHTPDPHRLKINEMLAHKTGVFQTPLPALTARVDAAQYGRARNETANCSTGQADHSDLSESSSAATPPFLSFFFVLPWDSTVCANERCCERLSSRQTALGEAWSSGDKRGLPLRTRRTLH